MESVVALEELVKVNGEKVALQKRQLDNHEAGVEKLSAVAKASAEQSLEASTELLAKYTAMLEELATQDKDELASREKLQAMAERKKYFDTQNSRIKLNKEENNDKKLEALRIIEELPSDVNFEDSELFEIATKSIQLSLPELNELSQKLNVIRGEFKTLMNGSHERDLQELGTINFLVPIIALHFHVLLSNIVENIDVKNKKLLQHYENASKASSEKKEKLLTKLAEEEQFLEFNSDSEEIKQRITKIKEELEKQEKEGIQKPKEEKFHGFPKFHDWWIRELWLSHQAYFALFKWKDIISNLCITTEQKKAWSIIFDRWIFIKKLLNDKGELCFNYNFAFDTLLSTHAKIEEELDAKNIASMEYIVKEITKKEDFTVTAAFHNVNTPYLKFKKEKLTQKPNEEKDD